MSGPPWTDKPTAADDARLRSARALARCRFDDVADARKLLLRAAFHEELGSVVRSASPLLAPLLALEGLTLDDAVELIEPACGWPRRPRLSDIAVAGNAGSHKFRHYVASLVSGGGYAPPLRDENHGHTIFRADCGHLRIDVVGHSLEVRARIAPVRFETRFGVLRVELDEAVPDALAIACVGRLIEDVVDHPVLRGRGWRVVGMEDPRHPFVGQVFVVVTGADRYRLPWAR